MKNLNKFSIALTVPVLFFSSCNQLKKFIKKQKEIVYNVSPNPIEMHGDSIQFSVSGKFNPKLFPTKVTATVIPVIKYEGGEKELKSITLVGEKAVGSGQKISYDKGGSFSYTSEKIPYEPGMKKAKVVIKAIGGFKSKTKALDPVEIADGTIITPSLVRHDEKPIFAKDNFVKTVPANQTTHIYYVINRSDVRPSEMKSEEMRNFITNAQNYLASQWYELKGLEVSAFASPDGETSKNENLAKDRANSAIKAMIEEFKKINKDKNNKFGKEKDQYKIVTTREDWEGFKELVQQSNLADRDIIIRVLSMYPDPNQRRKEIKNLSKTYIELADKILPRLRRAEIILQANKKSRTDEQIKALCTSNPNELSVEELLYGANLFTDLNTKLSIYQAAEKKYGNDWRISNNLGAVLLMLNKTNEAEATLKKALQTSNGNPIVYNNLGIIEAKKNNRKAAMDYYNKAAGAGKEVNYNKGIIYIADGKYSDAVSSFGDFNGFNKALAQLLSGSADAVNNTIDNSNDKDLAVSYYLKAIAAARKGNTADVTKNLKLAFDKDASLKQYAKDDAEFLKLKGNSEFESLVK
jgi:predicted Zn-dependent protease